MPSGILYIAKSFLVLLAFLAAALESLAQATNARRIKSDSLIAAAREIIGSQKYCALVTIDSEGRPNIRTMNPFPPEDDMTVWMATNSRSRKANDIRHNPSVCLYIMRTTATLPAMSASREGRTW